MHITGKVVEIKLKGKLATLRVEYSKGQETSVTVTANPPNGHEINVGDIVDIHIRPQDGAKAGVARHPR